FLRQVSALLQGKSGNTDLGHCWGQSSRYVEGADGNPLLARKSKDRCVQTIIVAPALEIFRRAEELSFRRLSGDIFIYVSLEGLLKIFDSNSQVRVELVKPFDDLQLVQMVVITVMRL